MKKLLLSLLPVLLAASCNLPQRAFGDATLSVFDHAPVRFLPDSLGSFSDAGAGGIVHLANGRILLKKISLPPYRRNVSVHLSVRVESAGDRWDKSGSVFVIPEGEGVDLLKIAKGEASYPEVDSTRYERLVGTVPGENYLPTVELLRFMTPFGVGYYSRRDTASVSRTRPVYIDGWADEAHWEADVSDLYPLLKGDAWVGVFIDTWTAEGYLASVEVEVKEDPNRYSRLPRRHVLPLVNTVYYLGQEYPDIFARKDLTVDFSLPREAREARLRYIVTGHGGHSGGDEFTPQENILSVDGAVVHAFTPWRTDCASYRRFNPTSGIWAVPREASFFGRDGRETKVIDEMLASSDLSRCNWCPGSDVPPVEIPLDPLAAGEHTFTVSIPGAQPIDGDKMNHWLVSACLVWEE